ncbi:MAG: hypothetical protein WDN48_10575 [Pseudolabrys sp.]
MKIIQISRTGGPDVLDTIELPLPRPGPGEVLVKAHAIGVAYFDMLIRSGRYPWMPGASLRARQRDERHRRRCQRDPLEERPSGLRRQLG